MMAALRLSLLLRRRRSGDKDPQNLTSVLAIIAFGSATALLLVILGGLHAFLARAEAAKDIEDFGVTQQYPLLAIIAALLLLVPLATLGGAAARLAVARRDARLAALRLAGATAGQVTVLTVLDALAQAVAGALAGVAGYLALMPLVAQLRFQGRTFDVAELWVGVPIVAYACAGVVVIALVSALVSLRRVAITPLGVATRVSSPGPRWIRVLAMFGAFIATIVVSSLQFGSTGVAIAMTVGVLILGFATINVVGPFIIWMIGRITAARARKVTTLLAGRRIADSPKTAWRSVGGVALATFIAGVTSTFAMFDGASNPVDAMFVADLRTGGFLTLAIAGILAAVSTGVMQAGRVIDQRGEYDALRLAGTDARILNTARIQETLIPLLAGVGLSILAILMFLGPLIGTGQFANPLVLAQFLGSVLGATGLVVLGSVSSKFVARAVSEV